MSGSAGGNRIPRQSVEHTVQDYIKNILSKFPRFKDAKISGSYNSPGKEDFGDIDLIVQIEGEDKKTIKKELQEFLESFSESEIVPFKSEKYKGKRTLNTGEIVTILIPITGIPGEYVQLDNIVSLTPEETQFKKTFLDYPAEVQGLILGLTKVLFLEEEPSIIFSKLGLSNIPPLEENQEYEFNLSSHGVTLRIVTLNDDYREINRKDVWKSSNWNEIKKLYSNYNIENGFETLLNDLKNKLKNPRSKNRVKGIFSSMISVKSGEVNTPKGDNKQKALNAVQSLLENQQYDNTIAIVPGGFKPPTLAHFHIVDEISNRPEVDKVIVLIGHKERDGITKENSLAIWNIYKEHMNSKIEILISPTPSPIKYTIDTAREQQNNYFLLAFGREESSRFKSVENEPNVKIIQFKEINDEVSGTNARKMVLDNNFEGFQKYIPLELNLDERKQIWDILTKVNESKRKDYFGLNQYARELVNETISRKELDSIEKIADEWFKKFNIDIEFTKHFYDRVNDTRNGIPITTNELLNLFKKASIKYGEKLSTSHPDFQAVLHQINTNLNLPFVLNYDYTNDEFDLVAKTIMRKRNFQTSNEKLPLEEDHQPDTGKQLLLGYIKSLTEYMIDQGLNIKPLPKLKIVHDDKENSQNFFGKTAYYDPNNKLIVIYTNGRHHKDCCRSYSHEMIHHLQNMENRLGNITTTNTNEDGNLLELEKEAYLKGNIIFRNWTDSLQSPLNEGKYDTISNKISSDVFNHWKKSFEAGKTSSKYNMVYESPSIELNVIATILFKNQGESLKVDGGLLDEDNETLIIEFEIDTKLLPEFWEEISMNLKDVVRHEIEHATQTDHEKNKRSGKFMEDDFLARNLIDAGVLKPFNYFKLKKEIDANLQGMYFRAKKEKRSFSDVINSYLDLQDITSSEKEQILDIWRDRAKALSLPKF